MPSTSRPFLDYRFRILQDKKLLPSFRWQWLFNIVLLSFIVDSDHFTDSLLSFPTTHGLILFLFPYWFHWLSDRRNSILELKMTIYYQLIVTRKYRHTVVADKLTIISVSIIFNNTDYFLI